MGRPVSQTIAIQPDGKTPTILCNALYKSTNIGDLVACCRKLSFGPHGGIDWGISGPVGGAH